MQRLGNMGKTCEPRARDEKALRSIREPHTRPLMHMAPPQRFRSCTGASVLTKTPGAETHVNTPPKGARRKLAAGA